MTAIPRPLPSLASRRDPLASGDEQRRRLRQVPIAREISSALEGAGLAPLRARTIDTLQINLGKVCNQTCRHCHVDAGPDRREQMSRETIDLCLEALRRSPAIRTVDLTGGAPELHPEFRALLAELRALGRHVIDRCNLTILETPSHRDLPELLASHRVEVVCSLPHHARLSTDRQRGEGVHERSIRALQRLNAVGYGDGSSGLRLVLITNPVGAFLPGPQASMDAEWKREMKARYGITFDALYTITNMPISRYLEWLEQSGNLERYLAELVRAFNPRAAESAMCRSLISVAWDGTLHDCDFNQMLEMPLEGSITHVRDLDADVLAQRAIAIDRHCYGCMAGAGSSCGGATT